MMPRIEAEQQLQLINAVACGFGGDEKGAPKYIRQLEAQARGDVKPKRAEAATAAMLAGMKIQVEEV